MRVYADYTAKTYTTGDDTGNIHRLDVMYVSQTDIKS